VSDAARRTGGARRRSARPDDPPFGAGPSEALPGWLHPLVDSLAGVTFADLARFGPPEDGTGRESAVLIALAETVDGPGVLLLERAATMRTHAGQVAFPGGAADPGEDPPATALREAAEEVDLDPVSVQVIATLPAVYLPPSGFVVRPVLAWWRDPHPVRAVAANEVAHVAVVAISELVDPANRFRVRHPSGVHGPGFEAGGLFVWGFTAGLLEAVLTLGGWTRDWDQTRVRDLPVRNRP
jgi:8-oxo-dGTP pyrophosphatase MutT (NUDIX family)